MLLKTLVLLLLLLLLQVWDYAGDNYVHRLIQSKTDGKLVEVPSPAPGASLRRHGSCSLPHDPRGPGGGDAEEPFTPEDDGFKEVMIASKLDAIAEGGPAIDIR